MSCTHELAAAFGATARYLRRVARARKFDRVRAAKPLCKRVQEYWNQHDDALFEHLDQVDGWEKIARHCRLAQKAVRKALSDADRQMLLQVLGSYGYYADSDQAAAAIVEATAYDTFEAAAKFALAKLGIKAADFELRNPAIRESLTARASEGVHATRNHADQVFRRSSPIFTSWVPIPTTRTSSRSCGATSAM